MPYNNRLSVVSLTQALIFPYVMQKLGQTKIFIEYLK